MAIVRVRARRQVTIPKEIFDRLGLHEGDFVVNSPGIAKSN